MPYINKEEAKARQKRYYEANKEKILEHNKKYYAKNKEKILAWNKLYFFKNKEKIKIVQKKWMEKNKEKVAAYMKIINATPERIQKRVEYTRQQRKINPNFKIRDNIARRVLLALKGEQKSKPTLILLGCTIEELWTHLENKFTEGMTKENHGKWHVDHIIPCVSFDLTKPEQQAKCFHYTNLQPLWAKDNQEKGAKYSDK